MREFTAKVFFNDKTHISVECDDFIVVDRSHYCAVKDGNVIMTAPFQSVKYTVIVFNKSQKD